MSLDKGGREGVQYLKVTDGKLRIKSNEEDEQAEKRVTESKDGTKHTFYERNFSKVTGYITDIRIQTHEEYGDSLIIVLEDVVGDKEEIYQLQMSDSGRYFQMFSQLLPNIDFSLPITFQPYSFTPEGAKYVNQGVKVVQGGEKIKNHYKTWTEKNGTKLKNGLQDFDFSKTKSKDQKKILRIQLTAFLKKEIDKQIKRLAKFFEALAEEE